MRQTFLIVAVLLMITFFSACKKDSNSTVDCFSDLLTVRQITNEHAVIKSIDGNFYIVEQGAIDSRLNPCNLKQEFQVNDLEVTISGNVKSTVQIGPGPGGTENFVITKISL